MIPAFELVFSSMMQTILLYFLEYPRYWFSNIFAIVMTNEPPKNRITQSVKNLFQNL